MKSTLLRATIAALVAGPASGAGIVVNTAADTAADDGFCSLREAILAANTNLPSGALGGECIAGDPDGDTINFFTGLVGTPVIVLGGTRLPTIQDDVAIDGVVGVIGMTISGNTASGIAHVDSTGGEGTMKGVSFANINFYDGQATRGAGLEVGPGSEVTLSGVTISGNVATGDTADEGGGGVFNEGMLTLNNVFLQNNFATGTSGSGGAIFNDGDLMITNGAIRNNAAHRAGGGIEVTTNGNATISGTTISGNTAGPAGYANPGNGGGIHITGAGSATITGGSFTDNSAGSEGGGLWNSSGVMTIDGTTITGNTASGDAADQGGGGIFNNGGTLFITGGTISGNTADGAAGSGGGILVDGGSASLSSSNVNSNIAHRAGGGIELTTANNPGSISILGTTLEFNNAGGEVPAPGNGGGLHVTGDGSVTIGGGDINNNFAAAEGGGLWNGSGTMTIDETMIRDNGANGDADDQGGGGIFNAGGTLDLTAVELEENYARGLAGSGGGILIDGGSATLTDVVLRSNDAPRAGGGIELNARGDGGASITIDNAFLQSNIAGGKGANPGNGGGLHVSGPGTVDITDGIVRFNRAESEGGGLWNGSGTMTITDVDVRLNDAFGDGADQGGGGIFNAGGTLNIIRRLDEPNKGVTVDIEIASNSALGEAGSGGGILSDGGTVDIDGYTVIGNRSRRAGGGIEITAANAPGSVTITDTLIVDNDTGVSLGAAPGNGGGLHLTGAAGATITGGTVTSNTAAAEGGGLWNGSGTMTIDGVTITGNTASGAAADQGGGGVFNAGGTLTITDVTISGNTANGDAGSGGGILTDGGTLTVLGGTIDGNTSIRAGGGIEVTAANDPASVLLDGVEIQSNDTGITLTGRPGNGGGLHVTGPGSITIDGGSFSGNTAAEEGGGLWNDTTGTMTIRGTTISGNVANGTDVDQGGGGIFNLGGAVIEIATIDGNISLGDDAGEGGGGIFSSGDLTIRGSEIRENVAITGLGNGGGILNAEGGILRISDTTIRDNDAARAGGGIENIGDLEALRLNGVGNAAGINGGLLHISGSGTARFQRSWIMGNEADNEGGGLWVSERGALKLDTTVVDGNRADFGGGVFVDAGAGSGATATKLMLTKTLVSRNDGLVAGGGILMEDGFAMGLNTTISSNSAPDGGGIFLAAESRFDLSFMTVANNTAAGMGGGVFNDDGTLTADNTIFAGNQAESGPSILGELDSLDFNVIDDTALTGINGLVGSSSFDINVLIEDLADNGGPTQTHALMAGSPAIDSGDMSNGPVQDQRTYGRIDGARDIGAFEVDAEPDEILKTSFEN